MVKSKELGNTHPRFFELQEEEKQTYIKKNTAYVGMENPDPHANVRSAEEFGVPGWKYACIRMNEKMNRLKVLVRNDGVTTDNKEPIEDVFRDLGVYEKMARIMYDEWKAKQPNAIPDGNKEYDL